ADKRRQGVEMAGEVPLGGGGIALRECLAYGTIASEVVTHRMLLHMCCSLHTEYTLSQPLKRPSQNNLEKCPVVKPGSTSGPAAMRSRPSVLSWSKCAHISLSLSRFLSGMMRL